MESAVYGRARWSQDDAREVLAALARSGKSVRVFCEEHGLDPQRVYLWRRRLGTVAKGDSTMFRELTVRPSSVLNVMISPASPFEVVLGDGVVVRVPAAFDSASLQRLLEVLQSLAC